MAKIYLAKKQEKLLENNKFDLTSPTKKIGIHQGTPQCEHPLLKEVMRSPKISKNEGRGCEIYYKYGRGGLEKREDSVKLRKGGIQ